MKKLIKKIIVTASGMRGNLPDINDPDAYTAAREGIDRINVRRFRFMLVLIIVLMGSLLFFDFKILYPDHERMTYFRILFFDVSVSAVIVLLLSRIFLILISTALLLIFREPVLSGFSNIAQRRFLYSYLLLILIVYACLMGFGQVHSYGGSIISYIVMCFVTIAIIFISPKVLPFIFITPALILILLIGIFQENELERIRNVSFTLIVTVTTMVYSYIFFMSKLKELFLSAQLSRERNLLKQRNDIIENDLALARDIQLQLLPREAPEQNIHVYYKPMEKVGGDLYDFFTLKGGKTGIFLSDVSGHGLPAAIITSMLKTLLIQAGEKKEDPALLLSYLNENLFGHTAGNFITVFYCVYDSPRGVINYVCAGHPAPFIICEGRVESLEMKVRGFPLTFADNDYLVGIGKCYRNSVATLAKGATLIMYTDGLTEAGKEGDNLIQFEEAGLLRTLVDTEGMTSRESVEHIVRGLECFRGGNNFDDDICIIALSC